MNSVLFLRTKTFPRGGEVVGILVLALGVAMGTGLASAGLVPVSQFLARTNLVALGGLPSEYQ